MRNAPGWMERKQPSAPLRRGKVPQKIYWEGINLNKISKKIVSAVTMGAFALTLLPAAAFAAPLGTNENGSVSLGENQSKVVYLDSNGSATVDLDVVVGNTNLVAVGGGADQIAVWAAEDGTKTPIDNVDFQENSASIVTLTGWDNIGWIGSKTAGSDVDVDAIFDVDAGEYDLYAAYYDGQENVNDLVEDAVHVSDITVKATDAVADGSRLLIDGKVGPAEATQDAEKTFTFDIWNGTTQTSQPLADTVYVWVENSKGEIVRDAQFSADKTTPVTDKEGVYTVNGLVDSTTALTVIFPDAGDGYSIHAATVEPSFPHNGSYVVVVPASAEIDPITVNVAPAPVVAKSIVVKSVDGDTDVDVNGNNYSIRIKDEVTPSNTKEYTVVGYAWVGTDVPAEGAEITLTPDAGMTIVGDTTVKTDNTGKFTFKYKVDDAASYIVKLVAGDATSYLKVTHGDVDAVHIEKIADGGKVLAGTDKDYAQQVYGDKSELFSDAIQIGITDAYGRDAVGEGVLADEWAARDDNAAKHADVVSVEKWAEGSDVDASNFYLAWDEDAGVYTLEYRGDAKDLTAGDYAVRIALNNGGDNAITVNFTAVEFGTVQDIVLDMTARPAGTWDSDADNNNAIKVIDDQVALGQRVDVTPKYVDENGLKVEIESYRHLNVGINGEAVAKNGYIWFTTQDNIAANNSLVGSTITVKVNDQNTNLYVEKELTVVKNYLNETVTIDPTEGAVGKANTVNVSVVDEDGNLSKVNGKLSATIVGQSDEEATVDLKVNPQVKNGTARMYLESDKAGTVDVRVVVTANNGELYADTFTYTFGDEDPYAGSYVVMTIGSDQYLINNKVLDGSVDNLGAPYVDSAWRTMVPVRVLAESFGAEVTFDEEAQTVTIVDGDTTIVMTVGSTEYTINGEAAEAMDTAPVIGSDNRTYVPVRFVAEGLGYEVTPLYNAENGTTASVVFQK